MKKKTIMIIAGVVIALVIAWRLASNKKELNQRSQPADTAEVSIPVKVAAVQMKAINMDLRKTGSVVAFRESKVLTTTSGTIERSSIELGQTVERGQILATLDHDAASLDLQKAESNASKLKADVQTYTELLQEKATTEQKVKDLTPAIQRRTKPGQPDPQKNTGRPYQGSDQRHGVHQRCGRRCLCQCRHADRYSCGHHQSEGSC